MKQHARVVIVGGGIMGASLLYHLAREGWTDSVLIEKAELTSGSTWHAAALCTEAIADSSLGVIGAYGLDLYQKIEEETGQSVSWHGCGSIRLAHDEDERDMALHTVDVAQTIGTPLEFISPERIAELHPFITTDGILGGLYAPRDGHVDPAGATLALAKGARQLGATVILHNRVTDIKPCPNGEWEVLTEQGNIVCEHVVNAGGSYAREIGSWVGLDLPIVNTLHQYLVTETVPEFLEVDSEVPIVRCSKFQGYVRQEQKSGLIGIFEEDPAIAHDCRTPPWEAENELFPEDYNRILHLLERAFVRFPILQQVGIKSNVNGIMVDTPDGSFLLGPAPFLNSFWLCCGASAGISVGPGTGKYLAQWMVHGRTEINMRRFDLRRFGPYMTYDIAITKSVENYGIRRVAHVPGFNRPAARPMRNSPVYEVSKERGAIFEEGFGWERPRWFAVNSLGNEKITGFRRVAWFDVVAEECRTVREAVGLSDLTAMSKFMVSGRDAAKLLNRVCANSVPRRTGGIILGHLLDEAGYVEGEIIIVRLADDRFYIVGSPNDEIRFPEWLWKHQRNDTNVEIENVTDAYAILHIAGPRSREVLNGLTNVPLDNDSFPWFMAKELSIAGHLCRTLRVSYTGELGWEFHLPVDAMLDVHDTLWEAGKSVGMSYFGSLALSSMRMEKAYKSSSDLVNATTLVSADMMRFADMSKGEFVGREATVQHMETTPERRLAYLAVDASDADCQGGEPVFQDGRLVGETSSGAYAFHVKQSLAFAFIDSAATVPGTDLEVVILGEKRRARVLAEPAYDPKSVRPRS